jgi:hypothetical protein
MKLANALKTLAKNGFTVTERNSCLREASQGGRYLIRFSVSRDGLEANSFSVRRVGAEDCHYTDYFAGTWCNNLKQAIELCN